MGKIKLAFIGCGNRMGNHLNELKNFDDVAFVGFYDVRPERAQDKQARVGQGKVYDSLTEMLDDAKPDAVYIVVPPDQHGLIEPEVISRGIPFFIEKPLAIDKEVAIRLAEQVKEKNLMTCVGFQDRYLTFLPTLKEWLVGKEIGLVEGGWCGGLPRPYWYFKYATCGGQILEQGIHVVDTIRYLFGEVKTVYCAGGRGIIREEAEGYDLHDFATAVFTMQDGKIVTLQSALYDPKGCHNGLKIYAKGAKIIYNLRDSAEIQLPNETHFYKKTESNDMRINRSWIDALQTGDRSLILSDYEDGLKSVLIGLACNESVFSGNVIEL
ncbi:MAG: Gfo/Idh/MocA family oxidoreductase [Oscillospiraceae bacterium]|jgi:predicted dehydrogenase|nr:Gfo/Idh/MocA family oxidoreductase [Oscillospiraceae bacterium]